MNNLLIIITQIIYLLICSFLVTVTAQLNRPPIFLLGGDMNKFSLREDTPVGTSVYTLRGSDPEKTGVFYYISGDTFTVNKDTGVVKLIQKLDREKNAVVDIIITITDEKYQGQDPNTVSVKREVSILDVNDSPPVFQNVPYAFSVDESTAVGTTLYTGVLVTDADEGLNSDIQVQCMNEISSDSCEKFEIKLFKIFKGRYRGEIVLKQPLNYEDKTFYTMMVIAEDMSSTSRQNTTAKIQITVKDTQDEPPVFTNGPYSATVDENTPDGTPVLQVTVHDGDLGDSRPVVLTIHHDAKNYFKLSQTRDNGKGRYSAVLETSDVAIDREDEDILNNSGLYVLQIKAIELVDGQTHGDSTITNVTIVIGDVNDQAPEFNANEFNVTISEDIGNNTPLPGLDIVVSDGDVGENAKFSLSIENVHNSEGVFSIFPTTAVGRTPVIIKVADADKLDYEFPEKRTFLFQIVVEQPNFQRRVAVVTVNLQDSNDNSPQFARKHYQIEVPENTPSGTPIYQLQASDADSGAYGKITYSLKGSDKFFVSADTGLISVAPCLEVNCLDYEIQQGYSLTYDARDAGGRVTTVNVFIKIADVNDNIPKFHQEEYMREIKENVPNFTPQFYVKATDIDAVNDGEVIYSIKSTEVSRSVPVVINPKTGEVTLSSPLKYDATPHRSGQIVLTVQATDTGSPPLTSEAKLVIKVRKENFGAPEFINEPYKAQVKENAPPGTEVLSVIAMDPDGPDSSLTYSISGGTRDNFLIGEKTGLITVSGTAQLDRDLFGDMYHIIVYAKDKGAPVQQTSTATVTVTIEDINNKPPVFSSDSYIQYIPQSLAIGEEVLTMTAKDPDVNSRIRYSIIEPITARDKTGTVVNPSALYNYKAIFEINNTTGQIKVAKALDYNAASVITFTVMAEDLNAFSDVVSRKQRATAEVTIYIQAHSELNPTFPSPWTPSNPEIEVIVPEEGVVGSTLLTLTAHDPTNHMPVSKFEKIDTSDPENFVSVSRTSGIVTLNRRLDYEALTEKRIMFEVKATVGDRSSMAFVIVHVQDINDNSPVFAENAYRVSISESIKYPEEILTVNATDADTESGFGTVQYSVSGDGSDVFSINKHSGIIQVTEGKILDRESQPIYNLLVTASDNPEGGGNRRKTSVLVIITLQDENDNPPLFGKAVYSAVVPENVPTEFSVVTVKATDPDEGRNGQVRYSIIEDETSLHTRLFSVDSESGVVLVVRPLTGKGRTEPYKVTIRATDKGNSPLFTDVPLMVIVGDVSTNDGVPQFVRPAAGEVAYIYENATVGTMVFHVIAFDPDSKDSSNGRVAYRFLDKDVSAGEDFAIDAISGVITSNARLDRERKENYTMIVVAHDFGVPPQEAHRVLSVFVLDVNDNKAVFQRPMNSEPVEFSIKEEIPIGTVIGVLHAHDPDKGDNAIIDYYITDGNANDVFGIRRTFTNEGELFVKNRVDRESKANYLLTIKVSQPSKPIVGKQMPYNPNELSEIQVTVKVQDIDDNPPVFEQKIYDTGIRLNAEVGTEILQIKAVDPDASSGIVTYAIKKVVYTDLNTKKSKDIKGVFEINSRDGMLKNSQSLAMYAGGYFNIEVEAQSSTGRHNSALAFVKVYILHDQDLMKFIFKKRPNYVQEIIPQFQRELRATLTQPVSLNIYETQFHTRRDGSLDFESASSCFQLLQNDAIVDPERVIKFLDVKKSQKLENLFKNYSVVAIEHCTSGKTAYNMNWSEIFLLFLAAAIAVGAVIITFIICGMFNRYKQRMKYATKYPQSRTPMQSNAASVLGPAQCQRIYEWQETNAVPQDAISFRSFPTLR